MFDDFVMDFLVWAELYPLYTPDIPLRHLELLLEGGLWPVRGGCRGEKLDATGDELVILLLQVQLYTI